MPDYQDIGHFLTLTSSIPPGKDKEYANNPEVVPNQGGQIDSKVKLKKRQVDKNIPANTLSAILTILQGDQKIIFKRHQQRYQSKCDKLIIAHFYFFCIERMKTKEQMNRIGQILLNKIQNMKNKPKFKLNPSNLRAIQKIQIHQKILKHLFLENPYGDRWNQMLGNFCWKSFKPYCEGLTQNTQKNQVLTSLKKLRTRQKIVKLVRARLLPNINCSIRVLTQNQDNTPGH